MRTPAPTHSAGFTLLEVIVALAIAAMGMTAVIAAAQTGLNGSISAHHYGEAVLRAQSRLAQIGVTMPLEKGEWSGADGEGFAWRARVSPALVRQAGAGSESGASLGLYAVEVTISWQDGGRARRFVLSSQRLGAAAKP